MVAAIFDHLATGMEIQACAAIGGVEAHDHLPTQDASPSITRVSS